MTWRRGFPPPGAARGGTKGRPCALRLVRGAHPHSAAAALVAATTRATMQARARQGSDALELRLAAIASLPGPVAARGYEGEFGPHFLGIMLRAVERDGGGANGNLYKRPEGSPYPELELWREVVDAGSAQPIGLSEIGMEVLGPAWTVGQSVSCQTETHMYQRSVGLSVH